MTPAWWRLAVKDLVTEARAKETLTAMLVLAFAVAVVGLLAFGDADDAPAVASGVLWAGLTFAASLGYARAFLAERDRGTWDALLALPVERGAIYLGKVAANYAVTLLVAALVLPAYLFLAGHGTTLAGGLIVTLAVLLGGLGLAAAGTVLAALAATTRARETLLPVLLVPVVLPVLVAGVHVTTAALAGDGWPAVQGGILLLTGYDLAFLAASWFLFDVVAESTA